MDPDGQGRSASVEGKHGHQGIELSCDEHISKARVCLKHTPDILRQQ